MTKLPVEGLVSYEVVGNQSGGDPGRLVGYCCRILYDPVRWQFATCRLLVLDWY